MPSISKSGQVPVGLSGIEVYNGAVLSGHGGLAPGDQMHTEIGGLHLGYGPDGIQVNAESHPGGAQGVHDNALSNALALSRGGIEQQPGAELVPGDKDGGLGIQVRGRGGLWVLGTLGGLLLRGRRRSGQWRRGHGREPCRRRGGHSHQQLCKLRHRGPGVKHLWLRCFKAQLWPWQLAPLVPAGPPKLENNVVHRQAQGIGVHGLSLGGLPCGTLGIGQL